MVPQIEQAPVSFWPKVKALLTAVASEKKTELLKGMSDAELGKLYSMASEFVDSVFAIEFNMTLKPAQMKIKHELDVYRNGNPGPSAEDRLLSSLFYELVPIFHYAEEDRDVPPGAPFTDAEFREFLLDFFESAVKGLPETREIELKTHELKRYPKTRVDLKPEDQLTLQDDLGEFTIVQACVFKVNRLNVLCGFFSENRKWRSEKYIPNDRLDKIIKDYNLVRRKLDS